MAGPADAGVAPSAARLAQAVSALRAGDVVAFPTETVYGLGADATRPEALERVYALKGRPRNHPLIVHLSDAVAARAWAREWPEAAQRLAARFWPGPLTLVLPRSALVPDAVTGGQDTVALRVPAHPVAQALLAAFGGAIAAPSANRYGHVSPTRAAHVHEEFGDAVPVVLDGGECDVGLESTIVACLGGRATLLRPGAITLGALRAVAGDVQVPAAAGAAGGAAGGDAGQAATGGSPALPRTPGSTPAHYAPRTPLALVEGARLGAEALARAGAGQHVGVLALRAAPVGLPATSHWLLAGPDAARFGHDLYARLRDLDRLALSQLLVERVPAGEAWDAVRDRLARAAAGSAGPQAIGSNDDDDNGDLP
jgi:L-threonylcarbamoyladenylate synthase